MALFTDNEKQLLLSAVGDPALRDHLVQEIESISPIQIPDGTISTAKLADGAVTNAKVSASAAIADSKLATSYLKADGTRALTGSWNAGAFSITANSVVVGSAANRITGLSTIVNTGTLTLPTSTDTLVGRATTDTLTNKSLTAPVITGAADISGATVTGNLLFTTDALRSIGAPGANRPQSIYYTSDLVGPNAHIDTLTGSAISGATNTLSAIPLSALNARDGARVVSSGTALVDTVLATVPFATEQVDTNNCFAANTFTAKTVGWHSVSWGLSMNPVTTFSGGDFVEMGAASSNGQTALLFYTFEGASNNNTGFTGSADFYLTIGQTIVIQARKNSAAAPTWDGAAGRNWFSVVYVGL